MLLLFYIITTAFAASLENIYLPPAGAENAGGHNSFLTTPLSGSAASVFKQIVPAAVPQASKIVQSNYNEPNAKIVKFENINDGFGTYSYGYDTDNHISVYESGQLKNVGSTNEVNVVHGMYSFKGNDGIDYVIEYTADENGFQAKGAHLPTPPPIPESILKSLEINAAFASDDDDGQYRELDSAHQTHSKGVITEHQKQGYNY